MCEHRTLKKKGLRRSLSQLVSMTSSEHRTLKKKGLRPGGQPGF